jgi:predicted short-subunit dehydrogenase-like oxidoreductase (DUF2520 family)
MIGAGKLGSCLGKELWKRGYKFVQVYDRNKARGKKLAQAIGASHTELTAGIQPDVDLFLIAVSDDAIAEVASSLPSSDALVVHLSGSTPCSVLSPYFRNVGVFYPVYSFNHTRKNNFKNIPVCIEAPRSQDLKRLAHLAGSIGALVYELNSEQRKILHLAAVFTNNFMNFMQVISEDILKESAIPPAILKPLLHETLKNASRGDVFRFQTGPAMRNDEAILAEHLLMLSKHPEYKKIYESISKAISKHRDQQ